MPKLSVFWMAVVVSGVNCRGVYDSVREIVVVFPGSDIQGKPIQGIAGNSLRMWGICQEKRFCP